MTAQAHDAVRAGIRKRIHQRRVDHAEHRRGRADAQRERNNRSQREARTLDELSNGVAKILKQDAHGLLLPMRALPPMIAWSSAGTKQFLAFERRYLVEAGWASAWAALAAAAAATVLYHSKVRRRPSSKSTGAS